MSADTVRLGPNKYGKAEVRLVRITRDTPRHEIEDLTITSQLRGDVSGSFLSGDNSRIVATDTQKNTVFAFAGRHGVGSPERFLGLLADHFTESFEWIDGGLWQAEQHEWARILSGGPGEDHSFVRSGQATRLAAVQVVAGERQVFGGVKDLTVLKSTGSEFWGYPATEFTTLPETNDRVMATSVTGRWRYLPEAVARGIDYNGLFDDVRRLLLERFADVHSLALQQTLYEMGRAVIEARPEIAEVRFAMPNKHHFVYDIARFGIENEGEVFIADDRPYGLIEGSVIRAGVADADDAWRELPSFV